VTRSLLLTLLLVCASVPIFSGDALPYRTDGGNEKLPWYQVKLGEFPPEGSAHRISGEIIEVDHVRRTAILRPDRNDSQRTDDYDKPMPFTMLPYGHLKFHGSFAEMRDIPIGTHMHGLFYADEKPKPDGKGPFTKCILLEDDFSYAEAQKRTWRIDTIQIDKRQLTVTGIGTDGKTDPKPTIFVLNSATRIWKGRTIGELKDLAVGQNVLINLTVCTLKGPGRALDVWIDEESRKVAAAHQLEFHRLYQREHGLACWVDEVDNKEGLVTLTVFDGVDPALIKEMPVKSSIAAAVAEDSLRTYDQINDTQRGPIVDITAVPVVPGCSGVRIKFKPQNLIEGFRPKRFLRIFAGGWRVDDLPREEGVYFGKP